MLPIYVVSCFLMPFAYMIKDIVEEKECRIKEGMKMMGLHVEPHSLSLSLSLCRCVLTECDLSLSLHRTASHRAVAVVLGFVVDDVSGDGVDRGVFGAEHPVLDGDVCPYFVDRVVCPLSALWFLRRRIGVDDDDLFRFAKDGRDRERVQLFAASNAVVRAQISFV